MQGLDDLLQDAGIPAVVLGEPPLFDVFFTSSKVKDYRGMQGNDTERAQRFNGVLRQHGILKGDSKFYVSLAHDDTDVAQTLAAFAAAVKAL